MPNNILRNALIRARPSSVLEYVTTLVPWHIYNRVQIVLTVYNLIVFMLYLSNDIFGSDTMTVYCINMNTL